MTLKKKSEEYVASIRSEKYAVGRTLAQKTIDGIVAGNAFAAGYRAALKDVSKEIDAISKDDPMNDVMCMTDEVREILSKLGEK